MITSSYQNPNTRVYEHSLDPSPRLAMSEELRACYAALQTADLLRHLRAGQRLGTADRRQGLAEALLGEDALAGLLHGKRVLLARGRLRRLAEAALLGLRLLQLRLRDRRLLRGRRRDRGLRRGRHCD